MSGLPLITDNGVCKMVENLKGLKDLNLSQCKMLTDKSIYSIVDYLTKIKSLNISQCPSINQDSIDSFNEKYPKSTCKYKR